MDYSLKSPGTKPMSISRASRSHAFPFSASFAAGYQRINEEDTESHSPMCATPPTPTTPLTPPHSSTADNVFTQVNLGQGGNYFHFVLLWNTCM